MESKKGKKSKRGNSAIALTLTNTAKDLLDQRAAKAGLSHSEYVELLIHRDANEPLEHAPAAEVKVAAKRVFSRHPKTQESPIQTNYHNDLLFQVGKAIAARRLELGFSQERVSELADLHRTYISDIEKGRRNLTLNCLLRLSAALQISVYNICRNAEVKLESTD